MGAVTGGVSGGLGQVFSASGFWGAVGSSAFVGAGTGGVTALLTGQNFLEGVLKGAVISGGVAAVSYTVNYFITNQSTTSYMEASDENILSDGTPVGNRSYARELYKSQFEHQSGLSSGDIYNRANPGGTMNSETGFIEYYSKNGEKIEALGVTTTKKDFISGKIKSKIYLSNQAFSSREQLSYVLQHELNHVRLDWSAFADASGKSISFKSDEPAFKYKNRLNNVGHYYIEESGTNFLNNNGWQNMIKHIPDRVFNTMWYHDFNEAIKKLLIGTDKKININFK
ncbi:hypothetical protein LF887_01410 [Chryseobacterium sp. MEBOG06]|uniref:hypothetical protein n=1 Tax=Chryseobacterium sp. MEBOG06 TaxID=2879938 RepID=UPI001F1766D1|nr:hypothetical protein [Chryseobacterium sp. MEBOG06]UKB84340.1 hypothetical protein LF887_01410 [Chryseobacterium sp. MEBOG06]